MTVEEDPSLPKSYEPKEDKRIEPEPINSPEPGQANQPEPEPIQKPEPGPKQEQAILKERVNEGKTMINRLIYNYFRLKLLQWFIARFLGPKSKLLNKLSSSNKLVFIAEFLPFLLQILKKNKIRK